MSNEPTDDRVFHLHLKALADGQEALRDQLKTTDKTIERRFEQLADAITHLAKHDERLSSLYDGHQRVAAMIESVTSRLESFEYRLARQEAIEETRPNTAENPGDMQPAYPTKRNAWIGALSATAGMVLGAIIIKGLGV